MSSRKVRSAAKRRKMAGRPYQEHLLDLFFSAGVDGPDLPGVRTADLRRAVKRRNHKVRS